MLNFIIFIGIILRIFYMVDTSILYTNHDLNYMNNSTGNYGYIYNLYYYGNLPSTNYNQFYHPPLFYILSTIVMKMVNLFFRNLSFIELLEASKIVSCFASCITLILTKELLDTLEVKDDLKLIPMLISAFLPIFTLMIGFCNNDSLVTMFILLTTIYTYKWWKEPNYNNIVLLALFLGLGMMAKMSCALMAFFILPIFIIKLTQKFEEKNLLSIIKQFILFGVICIPLGLWYPIRNYVLFNQSFNYVPTPGLANLNYIPILKRLFYLPLLYILQNPYFNLLNDTTIPINIIKTSLFDEIQFTNNIFLYNSISIMMIVLNILLIIFSIISILWIIFRMKKNSNNKLSLYLICLYLIYFVSYIIGNIKLPFVCTANFRYISILAIIGSIYLSYLYDYLKSSNSKLNTLAKLILLCVIYFSLVCFIFYY